MKYFHFHENTNFYYKTQGKSKNVDHMHIWRTLDECEIFFVIEGDLYIEQGGEKYHLKGGDYFISERNVEYGGYAPSTAKYHWCHFDYKLGDASFLEESEGYSIPQVGHFDTEDTFRVLLMLMRQYSLNPMKKSLMNEFLGLVFRDLYTMVKKPVALSKKDVRFQPILDWFHSNPYFSEVSTLKEMAEFFGFSEKYLIRLFKRNTGLSPMQYLTERKIRRAQEMLADTDMTVKAIATTLHYDYYYFMRLFRKHVGMTPNQFRNTTTPDCTIFVEEDKKK